MSMVAQNPGHKWKTENHLPDQFSEDRQILFVQFLDKLARHIIHVGGSSIAVLVGYNLCNPILKNDLEVD